MLPHTKETQDYTAHHWQVRMQMFQDRNHQHLEMDRNGGPRVKSSGCCRELKWGFLLAWPSLLGLCFTSRDGGNGTAGILADLSWKSWAGKTNRGEGGGGGNYTSSGDTKPKSGINYSKVKGDGKYDFLFPDLQSNFMICFVPSCWECRGVHAYVLSTKFTNSWWMFTLSHDLLCRSIIWSLCCPIFWSWCYSIFWHVNWFWICFSSVCKFN